MRKISLLAILSFSLIISACGKNEEPTSSTINSINKIETEINTAVDSSSQIESEENADTGSLTGSETKEDNTSVDKSTTAEDQNSIAEGNNSSTTSSGTSASATSTSATSTSGAGNKSEVEEVVDYLQAYNKILDRTYEILSEDGYWDNIREGETGICEVRAGSKNPFGDIGFILEDVNEDNIPELMITTKYGNEGKYDRIIALYKLSSGNPELVLEGYIRSAYYYAGNGLFIYDGFSGAAYMAFGNFKIDDNLEKLRAIDFYFSDIDEDYNGLFFHNHIGEIIKDKSDRIDITLDEFCEMRNSYLDQALDLETTPMAVYASEMKSEKAHSQVIIARAKEVLSDASVYEEVILEKGASTVKIAFSTKKPVKDFKILKLSLIESEDLETINFDFDVVYEKAELNKEKLIVATLSIPEIIPSYGFSYVDEGIERKFVITESGKDGTLELYEIK